MYGEKALSNAELIAIIIKTGTKDESSVSLAQRILSLEKNGENNLSFLQNVFNKRIYEYKRGRKGKSNTAKGTLRINQKNVPNPLILVKYKLLHPKDVAKILTNEMRYEKREVCKSYNP